MLSQHSITTNSLNWKTNIMWEPPTVQNILLTQCSKSKRYLYTTACSLAVCTPTQALPNHRSPQKLQRPLVSTPPSGKSIKMRMSDTLTSISGRLKRLEHWLKWRDSALLLVCWLTTVISVLLRLGESRAHAGYWFIARTNRMCFHLLVVHGLKEDYEKTVVSG
jgi:hypothetical protein